MAYEMPLQDWSFPAIGGPILQYRLVKVVATAPSPGVSHTTALLAKSIGVAQQNGTTSPRTTVSVRVFGITKVVASTAAIAVGDYLSPSSGSVTTGTWKGGCVKKSTAPKTSYLIGVALTSAAAGASNRIISMLLTHSGVGTTA